METVRESGIYLLGEVLDRCINVLATQQRSIPQRQSIVEVPYIQSTRSFLATWELYIIPQAWLTILYHVGSGYFVFIFL